MSTLVGGLFVAFAGLLMGSGSWPIKIMRKFRFEHWFFINMLVGLIVMPWLITLAFCPNLLAALSSIDPALIVKANAFSLGWGIANVLCGLCLVRIGFALTGGILTGLGVSLGVTLPLLVKGSGLFSEAPSLQSPAGHAVLLGVAVMLAGVILVALAGFGRNKIQSAGSQSPGNFVSGLVMVVIAGILSVGLSFSFVYSQDPIVKAMTARGANNISANFAVWAIGLMGGALINVLYPAYLMTKNKSWDVLFQARRDLFLSVLMGFSFFIGFALMGKGMLLLGALGASVGFGIQQSTQMLGNQGVGFLSGEWSGNLAAPRRQMYIAIALLLLAAIILAYGNTLAKV